MDLRVSRWIMRLLVLLSFTAFLAVLNYVNPESSGWSGKLLFYVTLGVFLGSISSLSLVFIRRKTLGKDAAPALVGLSIRQGILLAILTIGLLVLQSFRVLVWWDGLLLVAGVFLIELYFLSRN